MEWDARNAQGQLSELIESALVEGPQIVKARGDQTLILQVFEDENILHPDHPNVIDHLLSGPPWDDEFVEIVSRRDKTSARDISF